MLLAGMRDVRSQTRWACRYRRIRFAQYVVVDVAQVGVGPSMLRKRTFELVLLLVRPRRHGIRLCSLWTQRNTARNTAAADELPDSAASNELK